jgi:hypothetical protein
LAETIAGIKIPNLKVRGMPKYPNFLNNREATLSTPHRLQTYYLYCIKCIYLL